jgi:hypothetical protein
MAGAWDEFTKVLELKFQPKLNPSAKLLQMSADSSKLLASTNHAS